jgi:hypothetical protein
MISAWTPVRIMKVDNMVVSAFHISTLANGFTIIKKAYKGPIEIAIPKRLDSSSSPTPRFPGGIMGDRRDIVNSPYSEPCSG